MAILSRRRLAILSRRRLAILSHVRLEMVVPRRLWVALGALLLPAMAACTGTAVNSAQVYTPVSGIIQTDITVPAGESVTSVRFFVDDTLVSEDEDGSDGFSAELDTSELDAESLVKIKAVGVRANKSVITLRENYIMIGQPDDGTGEEATTESTTSPEPEASTAASPTPSADAT
jgi:hypothetical protein